MAKQARDIFRKDVVALEGFLADKTADKWRDPDESAFYYSKQLISHSENVRLGRHHFVAILIQLYGELDNVIWTEKAVEDEIAKWRAYRLRAVVDQTFLTSIVLPLPLRCLLNGHAILVYEWTL
jgi:hypothetical protein